MGRSEASHSSKETFLCLKHLPVKNNRDLDALYRAPAVLSIGRKMLATGDFLLALFRSHQLHPLAAFEDVAHLLLLDILHLPCWHFIFLSLSFVCSLSLHLVSILSFKLFFSSKNLPLPSPCPLCFNEFKTTFLLFVLNS